MEIEFASQGMAYPSGRVKNHSLQKKFSKLLQISPKNLQRTQKWMNKMRVEQNFIKKSWSKSFGKGILYNRVGFKCICATFPRQNTEFFYKLSTRATEPRWSIGGCHQCTKTLRRESLCFLTRNIQSHHNSVTWNLFFALPVRILLKPWTFSFMKDTITAKTVSKLKCLKERKKLRFTLQMKDPVVHSFVRMWDTFWEVLLVMNLE